MEDFRYIMSGKDCCFIYSSYICSMIRKNPYTEEKYSHYRVTEPAPLLEWLLANLKESKSKVKATLQNRGIRVNGSCVTQFDRQLKAGDKVSVSKSKKNGQFRSRYVKIVYEDRFLVVVEKNIGILSMAAGHASLNVKSILDDYFYKTRQKCTAHVVHRLDRDTSGLMIYAKDMQTEQLFEHDWHNIVYDRRYVGVVSGEMEQDEGTVANWLKDNKAYVTYSSPVDNGGKYAVTHFHVSTVQWRTVSWNTGWRQDGRIRFVYTRPTWDILSAAT